MLGGVVEKPVYDNFMLLFSAITILSSPKLCTQYPEFAQDFRCLFVQHFGELYGEKFIVYNVHGLLHLVEDVKIHGPLDSFSAFPSENYLGKLKQSVRKPEYPLAQIIRRLSEEDRFYYKANWSPERTETTKPWFSTSWI